MQNQNTVKQKLLKVVFLDRDGVINRDAPDYIKSWSEFEFLPNSLAAIKHLTQAGFDTIIITNQSVINRKMTSKQELESIHARMTATVQSKGGLIKDIFFCPHTPADQCDCRKPQPGLIYQVQKTYHINLASAFMVGDSAKDIECAHNAGCGHAILVKTGNGTKAEKMLAEKKIRPDYVAKDLHEAVNWITSHDKEDIPSSDHD
ncbi:D-glycero-beta-D-manno-heptose 1,7-bisphosphate 7-phosphatase [Thermodesulfobacteriota bacterium]